MNSRARATSVMTSRRTSKGPSRKNSRVGGVKDWIFCVAHNSFNFVPTVSELVFI